MSPFITYSKILLCNSTLFESVLLLCPAQYLIIKICISPNLSFCMSCLVLLPVLCSVLPYSLPWPSLRSSSLLCSALLFSSGISFVSCWTSYVKRFFSSGLVFFQSFWTLLSKSRSNGTLFARISRKLFIMSKTRSPGPWGGGGGWDNKRTLPLFLPEGRDEGMFTLIKK